jgi:hypothetical protein
MMRRRAWLGGAAAGLALPMLDALRPRHARAAASPQRLLCYYTPNGMVMSQWRTTEGALVLSPTLSPLAGLEERLLVVDGLANAPAVREDGPGAHETGTTGFLTTATIDRAEDRVRASISMDQVYAQHLGDATSRPSLQLGIERGDPFGSCANGFACAYSRSISWAGPTSPLPTIVNPRVAFSLLFAGFDPAASAIESTRRQALRASVIDAVKDEADRVRRGLGSDDLAKLDEHLAGIRDLERRIDRGVPACAAVDPALATDVATLTTPEHVELMHAIMVLALRCDITRVVSFMLGNSASNRSFDFIGIPDGHHDLSHHAGNDEKIAKLVEVERWQMERFAALLRAMDDVQDGDGTLLDHTTVLFSSELSSGNLHGHDDLPVLVAGGATPWFRPGRTLVADGAPLASLHVALLQGLGVAIDRFGDDGESALPGVS